MSIIDVQGLSKTYGDVWAVRDVTVTIDSGEIYGLLGPNGAGKTTTIEMLTGQTTPDSGSLTINGTNPVTDPVETREQLGILPERESPPTYLTPREYFELIAEVRGISDRQLEQEIRTWADRLDFTDQLDTLHTHLSRGQQQKAMITQAFLHSPSVVIIDEPLVNLDPIMQERVKESLQTYAEYDDNTVVLSTHDTSVANDICTRAGIVDSGSLTTEIDLTGEAPVDILDYFEGGSEDNTSDVTPSQA